MSKDKKTPQNVTNVVNLGINRVFKKEQELADELVRVIHSYDNEISLVSAIGAIEIAKMQIIDDVSTAQ